MSCISLAGWCSGRFNAVKLCQSSSISGPSEISKPIFKKISIILFFTIDIGCFDPNFMKSAGFVKSWKLSFDDLDKNSRSIASMRELIEEFN